jgi:hypothetical protein
LVEQNIGLTEAAHPFETCVRLVLKSGRWRQRQMLSMKSISNNPFRRPGAGRDDENEIAQIRTSCTSCTSRVMRVMRVMRRRFLTNSPSVRVEVSKHERTPQTTGITLCLLT